MITLPDRRFIIALWLFGGLLAGCGGDPTAPEGVIEVVSVTAGDPADADGYTLAVDGDGSRTLGTNSTLTVSNLSAGNHQLELGGVATNCVLAGPNPRTVAVSPGAPAQTRFELQCSAPTGSIELTTVTTGESLDPDGYLATLDSAPGRTIASNGTIVFAGLTAGSHSIVLTGIAPNCTVGGENPRILEVGVAAAATGFEIICGPPTGSIRVSTVTQGPRPDQDGYAASVDGGLAQEIRANGAITFSALPIGNHSVLLSGVAANCVVGENPRVVPVTNGQVVSVAFQVSCFPNGSGTLLFASDRSGASHLYRMREDGADILDLTPSMDGFDGDWSPDGLRIVFTTTRNEGLSISVMNADGSNQSALGVAGGSPKWSPDGQKILWSDGTIRVMNADGTHVIDLTTGTRPDWSPDGTRIAFDRLDLSGCVFDLVCPEDIYVMAADGTQILKLTANSGASTAPAWSPDGTRIAYARQCCLFGSNQSGLWTISPNGGSPTRIDTRAAKGRPVWSPDGLAIAFAVGLPDGTTQLTMIPSSGGAGVGLASSSGSEYPQAWK